MTYTLHESPSRKSWQVRRNGLLMFVTPHRVEAEKFIADCEAIPVKRVERGVFVCTAEDIDAGSGPVDA